MKAIIKLFVLVTYCRLRLTWTLWSTSRRRSCWPEPHWATSTAVSSSTAQSRWELVWKPLRIWVRNSSSSWITLNRAKIPKTLPLSVLLSRLLCNCRSFPALQELYELYTASQDPEIKLLRKLSSQSSSLTIIISYLVLLLCFSMQPEHFECFLFPIKGKWVYKKESFISKIWWNIQSWLTW